ncbi:alpha/beta fold hydrolase [Pseudomonas putida]|uniref:Alpha/beta fold hydrolase n=1 Tax=Pseudomonas putida TaxID=303 RepID=A0A7W2L1N1_PSEPU|nr:MULTISPECIES: alpha/beta fold hydrolase [Pseudomonas]MBA6116852.1 alpha/beta fold hydrolase [Pseudomonas putida]MBI6941315.1 alpha/beta fold hydrolase [Pseudomonas putida]MBI6959553.1 alpha/beta fold hydrolase [Pseudomonas putida]MCZ9637625.1 alpha/beta hydrolase [Pseudomonas putida]MEC4876644.1 alpha/beta hydrolase [Pseudomonas sp. NC26]
MPTLLLSHLRRRWLTWLCATLLIIGLPAGCAVLQHKERELVFRIEPGQASWFHGLPSDVQELDLRPRTFTENQSLHAWWWPAKRADAPAILYLHGVRWNLTGQLFRIQQLHAMGYSVLAVDYRGFGQSRGDLPSEATVYEDARIAWERFAQLQPNANKRLIFGHSLGGAVAVELATELARQAQQDGHGAPARGLILESTFTSLGDVAAAVADTTLPVRWLLSQKFDSLDKIKDVGLPLLLVHGLDDRFVPARFSQQLFEAAQQPKTLLLVPGATHNNSMSLAGQRYRQAIEGLL